VRPISAQRRRQPNSSLTALLAVKSKPGARTRIRANHLGMDGHDFPSSMAESWVRLIPVRADGMGGRGSGRAHDRRLTEAHIDTTVREAIESAELMSSYDRPAGLVVFVIGRM